MKAFAVAVALLASLDAVAADQCLTRSIDQIRSHELHGQIIVSTLASGGKQETQVLAGAGAPQGELRGNEGFRIASVTKTYVAATVLRLWEDGKLDIEAPMTKFLPGEWMSLLAQDGYRPEQITVRHLLTHTAGLADHAQTPQFLATIKEKPATEWTRPGNVKSLVEWTDPVGAPGEKYSYSDTGYVLLGAIVERITGQDLPGAVRAQLKLDAIGPDTYWERYEPARGRTRAHQIFESLDTYDWNPSMDLFGGGGLVAPPRDLAAFFDALLRGRIFSKPQTLERMRSAAGLPQDSPYRLGLLVYDFEGVEGIGHSGFWGTLVVHEPASGRTIAGAVTDRADFPMLKQIVGDYVRRSAVSLSGSPGSRCE